MDIFGDVERTKKIQRLRLENVVQHTAGWGVLIYCEGASGDVSFLAPICPKLRGYEIVSADGDGRYDVWRRPRTGDDRNPQMTKYNNMTLQQLGVWLKARSPTERQYMKNAAKWAEETLQYYAEISSDPMGIRAEEANK